MYFWSWFLPVTALLSQVFFHVVFYLNKSHRLHRMKIQPAPPAAALQRREIGESLVSVAIFALAG